MADPLPLARGAVLAVELLDLLLRLAEIEASDHDRYEFLRAAVVGTHADLRREGRRTRRGRGTRARRTRG